VKKLCLLWILGVFVLGLQAQEKLTVTGRVIDATTKKPVEVVSVLVKGSLTGTTTDANGAFTISALPNATLTFSGIGYSNQEVAVGGRTSIDIELAESAGQLEGVVVTALGLNRQKRDLGYATQQIGGADLQIGRENNVANALVGRTAGVVINRSSAGPGSSTRISLRGERSIRGDNGPLIVIDGVPVDNSVRGNTGEFGGSDGGDAISNLNPDDIESMNILRGPNAAALYGARASNGVLMITTKKGRNQKGLGISFNNNTAIENPFYSVDMQNQFAQGSGGSYVATDENSWGPRITGQQIQNWKGENYNATAQDHNADFFNTGISTTNNIALSAGNDVTQVRFSYNNLNATGLVPNNSQNRHSFTLRSTSTFGKLNIDAKINYINQLIKNRPQGGEEAQNPYSNALRMPTTVRSEDLANYINESGPLPRQSFFAPNSAIIGNPYWMANKLSPREERNRLIASAALNYKFNNDIGITARAGIDRYNDDNSRRLFAGTPTPFTNNSAAGNYNFERLLTEEFNAELFATYNKSLSENFKLSGVVGTALRKNRSEVTSANAGGLDIPDLFTMTNGRAVTAGNGLFRREIQSIYGSAQLSWKDAIYLDLTGRNDWASTLPAANRSFFYPSASLSTIVSDLVEMPKWWNYAKFRTSYAFVGKEAPEYQTIQTLSASLGIAGTILRNRAQLVNTNLKPEQTRSFEIGGEFRFADSRIGLDVTYYKTNTFNQVIGVPLVLSSGFNEKIINAGKIQNNGIEVLLDLGVIRKTKFRWDMAINFSTFRSQVIELDKDVKFFNLGQTRVADVRANEGERLGNMYVNGFQRNADGDIEIGFNGLPIRTQRNVLAGNVFPDWNGGINNTFTLGNWSFDFLVDGRFGGVVASHTQAVLGGLGKLPETVTGREANSLVVPGVLAGTKTPNNITTNAQAYWQFLGGRGNPIGEAWVYDATNIRLRQATLSYKFPSSMFTNGIIQGVNVSVYGRNLFFFKNDAPFDPEVSLNTGIGGQGIDFYSLPTTRSLGINVNVNF